MDQIIFGVIFGVIVVVPYSLVMMVVHRKNREKLKSYGLGMAVSIAALIALGLWAQTNKQAQNQPSHVQNNQLPAVNPPVKPAKDHNYDMRDGAAKYGYTAALSPADKNAGKAANDVVLFAYAGERDGKYQVHSFKGNSIIAAECSAPCDYIKVIGVFDTYNGPKIDVKIMKSDPEILVYLALQDAINGKLTTYVQVRKNGRYQVWIDERKGVVLTKEKT